jgi:ActR/RegA family two-component response regulator
MNAGRLLILDDDAAVGQMLAGAAQALGFAERLCTEVADFLEALEPWAPTHLAIDLSLPGSSGEAVMRLVAGTPCRARVIVFSGAGAAELEQAVATATALGLPVAGVLPKPFRLAALRALLQAP